MDKKPTRAQEAARKLFNQPHPFSPTRARCGTESIRFNAGERYITAAQEASGAVKAQCDRMKFLGQVHSVENVRRLPVLVKKDGTRIDMNAVAATPETATKINEPTRMGNAELQPGRLASIIARNKALAARKTSRL